jgi:hypothetical protein
VRVVTEGEFYKRRDIQSLCKEPHYNNSRWLHQPATIKGTHVEERIISWFLFVCGREPVTATEGEIARNLSGTKNRRSARQLWKVGGNSAPKV